MTKDLLMAYAFGFIAAICIGFIRGGIKEKRKSKILIAAIFFVASSIVYFSIFF